MIVKLILQKNDTKPLWNFHTDGCTQSLIQLYRLCPEQCKLNYYNGWSLKSYKESLHFGLCVHYVLAELYTSEISTPLPSYITRKIKQFEELWEKEQKTPLTFQQENVNEYIYSLADAILLEYFQNYKEDWDNIWEFTESNFNVEYSSHSTFLRGKIDGAFIGKNSKRPWLIDHKCLSVINKDTIVGKLKFDTQCWLYMLSYKYMTGTYPAGIVYNIIRRPQSKLKVNEQIPDFAKRISETVQKKPEHYFIRIKLPVLPEEIDNWEKKWLQPNLTVIGRWYDRGCTGHTINPEGLETKYGRSDFFNMLINNSNFGYYRREHVFPELISEF